MDKSKGETRSLEKSVLRLETILTELERLIEENQNANSEALLTRFSKNLRHLLHEGASSILEIEANIDYAESKAPLVTTMNLHSWAYEINKDMIHPIDQTGQVKTMLLSYWLFYEL